MQIIENDRFRFRLRQVVEFLANHLDQPPRLEDLAEVAGMSAFHFLRVYARYMGETPMATSRRLRLNLAWTLLAKRNRVGDVARSTGYRSSQAFSNAFRERFGMSPSRAPGGYGLPALPPHLERITARPLASIPFRGLIRDSVHAFDELFKALHRNGDRIDIRQIMAVVPDAPDLAPDRMLGIQASVAMPRGAKGVDHSTLPDCTYVVVRSNSPWPEAGADDVARITRAASTARLERADGPMLVRPVLDPYRTAPTHRLWEILYPVRPIAR